MSRDCTQGQKCYGCEFLRLGMNITDLDTDINTGGEVGHLSRDCPNGGSASQDRLCYRCKKPGHVQADCPEA